MAWDMKKIAVVLAGIGALNWGLVSFFGFNVVTWLQSIVKISLVSTVIYALVGIAGAYVLFNEFKK